MFLVTHDMSGATPPAAPLSRQQTRQIGSSNATACRASPHSFGPILLRCSGRRLLIARPFRCAQVRVFSQTQLRM
ncbi:MAG: hypothetical protein JSR58_01860 [Verrucomicrobia bacterium]|nr:hypothetical protein [Verrucomicrobiota bacterium]